MIIDNEFKNLLPYLLEEDYKRLEESIKAEGCRDPLVVWGDILVDGHNRYKICTEHNIPFQIVQHDFKDRNEAIVWIISNQLSRRNLTAFQRSELALRLKPMLAEKGKVNMSAGGKGLEKLPKVEKVNTREEIGKLAGVSGKTVDSVETILNQGTPEDIKEVREGKASIFGKAKEIKERSKPEKVTSPETRESDKEDMSKETVDKTLVANLYSVFKTLRGTREMLAGNLCKQDEKELIALINKLNQFIERKGGIQYEESK